MKKTVLIVDDEEILCDLLGETLEAEDFDVYKVYNGETATEILSQKDFDFAIIDLFLPGKSGIEVLQYIHENKKNIKVIMASGYSEVPTAVEAMKLGASDFLIKPFNLAELKKTINRIINATEQGSNNFVKKIENLAGNFSVETTSSDDIENQFYTQDRNTGGKEKSDSNIFEPANIRSTLNECKGNRTKAAEKLGISLKTLYQKIKEYGIE